MDSWIEYPYVRWNATVGFVECRPLVTVTVCSNNREITLDGLVDSGCETCMINVELAEPLGVDLAMCERVPVGGVGGKGIIGYLTTVKINLRDVKQEFETPIIFSDIPFQLLLGQSNFFINFKVLFERDLNIFKLQPIPRLQI